MITLSTQKSFPKKRTKKNVSPFVNSLKAEVTQCCQLRQSPVRKHWLIFRSSLKYAQDMPQIKTGKTWYPRGTGEKKV